jgi:pentapeptide repeat protein
MGVMNGGPVNLASAGLRGSSLRFVMLADANLAGADPSGADLTDARLDGANLTNADLSQALRSSVGHRPHASGLPKTHVQLKMRPVAGRQKGTAASQRAKFGGF